MSIEEVVEILKMHRNAFAAEHRGSAITAFDIAINTLSAPHEMTAREFAEARDRLCDSMNGCTGCPIYKACLTGSLTKILPMVEAWAQEHPDEEIEQEEIEAQREYEAAVEYAEYCKQYEPTYNPEDGSM